MRALLLDLDDTLYDRGAAFRAWADALARVQLGRVLADVEFAALADMDRRGHRSRAELALEAYALGLSIDPLAFPSQLAEHIVEEPGVRDTIGALARSRPVAIVTNGGPVQRLKLARIGLDRIVEQVFVSSELGHAKPDRAIFEQALAWTGEPAEHVLFVGDHPTIDLAPARELGMATAWRVRPGCEWPEDVPPPTYRLTRIAELAEVCA
ncbi:MAG TPA: HAD family hydrolase [Kofleriaceae bacterium]|nr:HAD family hydrolase [Kofleriaceae bacterium]